MWKLSSDTNLLQSWFYGESKSEAEQYEVINFCISDSGQDIALVQILRKKILFFGVLTRINRGPIFLTNNISLAIQCKVIEAIINELKKDSFLVQIAPEMQESESVESKLKELGFKRLTNIPWSSGRIDLSLSEDELLMSLNGKWRNCYRKGKKLGVQVSNVSDSKEELENLLQQYESLQAKREFSGLSKGLITSLASKRNRLWSFNIFKAIDVNDNLLGYLVTIDHGETSIYLIGVTTSEGRKLQANYVMLWDSIQNSKQKGLINFDIGGLTSETPKGIAHFKKGLNPVMYSLTGEWRRFYLKNIIRF